MAVGSNSSCRSTSPLLAAETQPDLILLDVDLAGELNLDFLPTLLLLSSARALIFTGVYEGFLHERALREGACGVVRKDASAEVLLQAITRAYQNRCGDQFEEKPHSASQSGAPLM